MTAAAIECLDDRRRGLAVELLRRKDRWAHRVLVYREHQPPHALLESFDAATDASPRGFPAYQHYNVEAAPECDADSLALIGMSNDCLWSLAIEPRRSANAIAIHFDAACRIKQQWVVPRSVYRCPGKARPRPAAEGAALELDGPHLQLLPLTTADTAAPALSVQDDDIQLEYRGSDAPTPPLTVRWQYAVQFTLTEL